MVNKDLVSQAKVLFLKDRSEGTYLEPTIENYGWNIIPVLLFNQLASSKDEILLEYFAGLNPSEIAESVIVFYGENNYISRVTIGSLLEDVAKIPDGEEVLMFSYEPTQILKRLPEEYSYLHSLTEFDYFASSGIVDFYTSDRSYASLMNIAIKHLAQREYLKDSLVSIEDYIAMIERNCDIMKYPKLDILDSFKEFMTTDILDSDSTAVEDILYQELAECLGNYVDCKARDYLYQVVSLTLILGFSIYHKVNNRQSN